MDGDKFLLVQPRVAVHAVFGKAGVKIAHGVTVRVPQGDDMGMAEACPEPVEGKTLRGVSLRSYPSRLQRKEIMPCQFP